MGVMIIEIKSARRNVVCDLSSYLTIRRKYYTLKPTGLSVILAFPQ